MIDFNSSITWFFGVSVFQEVVLDAETRRRVGLRPEPALRQVLPNDELNSSLRIEDLIQFKVLYGIEKDGSDLQRFALLRASSTTFLCRTPELFEFENMKINMKTGRAIWQLLLSILKEDVPLGHGQRIRGGYLVRAKCLQKGKYGSPSTLSPGTVFVRAKAFTFLAIIAFTGFVALEIGLSFGLLAGVLFALVPICWLPLDRLTRMAIGKGADWMYIVVLDDGSVYEFTGPGSALGRAKRNEDVSPEEIGLVGKKEIASGKEYELARKLVGKLAPELAVVM